MDITLAAENTRMKLIESAPADWPPFGALSQGHVESMLERIEAGEITGEKAHRWLGWAQAACVSAGAGTLDEMKAINKAA